MRARVSSSSYRSGKEDARGLFNSCTSLRRRFLRRARRSQGRFPVVLRASQTQSPASYTTTAYRGCAYFISPPFRPELRATHLVDHLPEQPLLPNHLETSLLCAALHKHPRRVPRRCERRAFRRRNRARELLRARKVSCGVERAAEDEPCRPCSPRSSSRPPSLLLPTQRTYRVPRSSLRGSQTYPAR